MQLQYAQHSTSLLAEPFVGSLPTDCTNLLDRKPPKYRVEPYLEPTGLYLVGAEFAGWDSRMQRVDGCRTTLAASNQIYVGVAEPHLVARKVLGQIDAKWIFNALRSNDPNGIEYIGSTIDGVNSLIAVREFRFLDRVFEIIPPATASRHVLLALLRATAPVRSKLTAWQQYAFQVRDAFDARGLNSARLLRGLLD